MYMRLLKKKNGQSNVLKQQMMVSYLSITYSDVSRNHSDDFF